MNETAKTTRLQSWPLFPSMRKKLQSSILILGIVAALSISTLAQNTIYVDHAAIGLNDGSNWANAYSNLQSALTTAVAGNEIWVAQGTYQPASPGGLPESTFQLKSEVALYGGFAGTEMQRSQRNPAINTTTLTADLNGDDGAAWSNMADNVYHIVTVDGLPNAVLDGFKLTRGRASSATWYNSTGPAVLILNSTFTMNSCEVTGNLAQSGGGLYTSDSTVSINDCNFHDNYAFNGRGGAIYTQGNDPDTPVWATIRNTQFVRNYAESGISSANGGAIWSDFRAPIDIENCLFESNAAQWRFANGSYATGGGAILIFGEGSRIANSVFRKNRAHIGGAVWVGRNATIENCLFVANEAYRQSVGFYDYGGYAGTIYAPTSELLISGCTFHANIARTVGGVWAGNTTTIANSILWSNISTEQEARLLDMQIGGTPILINSCVRGLLEIIPGEDAPNPNAFPGMVFADPVFIDADGADNILGNADDDLRLGHGSPCIDAASNNLFPAGATNDLAYNTRFFDDPSTPDSGIGPAPIGDMGAYEFGPWQHVGISNNLPIASFTSATNNTSVDFSDTSTDSDGTISAWIWDFGDFTASNAQHPTHVYPQNGSYDVHLTVRDNENGTDRSITQTITITGYPPHTASITAPGANSTNTWIINLAADTADSPVLTRVKFYVDGNYIDKDEAAPFSISWDTRTVVDGVHTLSAKATDGDQIEVWSADVDITVDNQRAYIISDPFDVTLNVGTPFETTIDVTGTPAPVFSLLSPPEGASIHPHTGLISWTPLASHLNSLQQFTVAASNQWDVSMQTAHANIIDNEAPTVPGNCLTTNITTSSALLTWDPATDNVTVAGYQVWYFSKINRFPGHWKRSIIGVVTNTSVVVSPSPTATYTPRYAVSAIDSSGNESARGSTMSVLLNIAPSLSAMAALADATVGQSWSFDVNATGRPLPTYVLTSGPAGMTINPATGLLQWIPAVGSEGLHTITVRAANIADHVDYVFDAQALPAQINLNINSSGTDSPNGELSFNLSGGGTNWVYTLQSRTNLQTGIWAPFPPAEQWPVAGTHFPSSIIPTNQLEYFRIKAELTTP